MTNTIYIRLKDLKTNDEPEADHMPVIYSLLINIFIYFVKYNTSDLFGLKNVLNFVMNCVKITEWLKCNIKWIFKFNLPSNNNVDNNYIKFNYYYISIILTYIIFYTAESHKL